MCKEQWNPEASDGTGTDAGAQARVNSRATFWNRFAPVYDLATSSGDAGLAEAASYVASFVRPTDVVLDAACGTGAFACA